MNPADTCPPGLEYTKAFAAMIVYPVTSFVVPLAINRLLTYVHRPPGFKQGWPTH